MKKVLLCVMVLMNWLDVACYGMSSYRYLRPFQYSFVKALEKNNVHQMTKCLDRCPALLTDRFYVSRKKWFTALQLAAKIGCLNAVDLLIKGGSIACIQIEHRVEKNELDVLMQKGAQIFVNVKNGQKETALHCVAYKRSNRSDVDGYNNEMKERVAILNRLIGAGADINALDIHLRTPLHYAVCYGCFELVSELLEYARTDGSLNVRDENGWTPLFTAVVGEHTRESLALIQAGADVSISTNDNKTPLQIAAALGMAKLQRMIKSGMAQSLSAASTASSSSQDVNIKH